MRAMSTSRRVLQRCTRRWRASSPTRSASSWASKAGCVTSAVLRSRAQHFFEPPAGARQPRHDRAYGHARHLRDLLIGQLLQLSQHDHLAVLWRQHINRAMQHGALALPFHGWFWILARLCLAVLLLN